MKIALGADHAGARMKDEIAAYLSAKGYDFEDFGIRIGETCDYPYMAEKVCKSIASGLFERGILVCGTGIGMSIAANKVRGIRAAACNEYFSVLAARQHNDANVLCLGERVIGQGVANMLAEAFLTSEFDGGRHSNRIDLIKKLEEK